MKHKHESRFEIHQFDTKTIRESMKKIKIASCIKSVNAASEMLNAEREKLELLGYSDVEINTLIISLI